MPKAMNNTLFGTMAGLASATNTINKLGLAGKASRINIGSATDKSLFEQAAASFTTKTSNNEVNYRPAMR